MGISNIASNLRPGVCTFATRPTTPYEGQVIYETDTDKVLVWNGTEWYPNWNVAWGKVALSTLTSNGQLLNTETTRTSVTFTSVANRQYKISWFEPDLNNTNNATNTFYLRLDNETTGTIIGTSIIYTLATASDNNMMSVVTTFTAGSRTIYARYFENAGTATNANASSTKPAYLLVEDIGPA